MKIFKRFFIFLLWFLFFVTFTVEIVKLIFEQNPDIGHKQLGLANAFFWSSLFLIEMIMAGLVIIFIVKYPSRRKRLVILSACHFSVILLLPVVFNNWSWTCLLYPWPHSLQAFDPKTPQAALLLSSVMGFFIVPLITLKWGAKGFCGYICPHGAFFSETYGRVFSKRYKGFDWLRRYFPPIYFTIMTASLIAIIFFPDTITQLRSVQKMVYFITAEFLYFVICIPLFGGRSYCTLFCPMGYYVNGIVKLKNRLGRSTLNQK